ncbi:hypothetical protein H0H93_015330 [Arthromyces matolae]|nr:hypothetical protein H0H93_015330 [Arthromyces matolae]
MPTVPLEFKEQNATAVKVLYHPQTASVSTSTNPLTLVNGMKDTFGDMTGAIRDLQARLKKHKKSQESSIMGVKRAIRDKLKAEGSTGKKLGPRREEPGRALDADSQTRRKPEQDWEIEQIYNSKEVDMLKELVEDFGLEADANGSMQINRGRFMRHIGIKNVLTTGDDEEGEESPPLVQVTQAYQKLNDDELVLFLKVRNLPTTGTHLDLASRLAHHDIHTYHFPSSPTKQHQKSALLPVPKYQKSDHIPGLPIEILAYILDFVGDWELAKAVRVPTSLPRPLEWSRASCADHAMLPGSVPLIRAINPCLNPPTKVGAILAIRFGYVDVLEYFLSLHLPIFRSIFNGDLIPIKASRHGRTEVLSWWKRGFEQRPHLIPPPAPGSVAEAIDGASRNGQVSSLDWWSNWGRPMEYTEAALEQASAKNRISVLDWWLRQHKLSGLPLKIGRVMETASTAGNVQVLEWWAASRLEPKYDQHAMQHASCHGKVEVLQWWLRSGLQVKFDEDALIGATRHNRPEVLEWWDKSGLPIQYRMCDVEEALEDAIGGGEEARVWWKRKGIDFNADDKEWTKSQNLN